MHNHTLIALLPLLAPFAPPVHAEVWVQVELVSSAIPASVHGKVIARSVDGRHNRVESDFDAMSPGTGNAVLGISGRTSWVLRAEADGYFGQDVPFPGGEAAPVLKLWRTATIRGRARFPDGVPEGSEVLVRFRPAPPAGAGSLPEDSVTCPLVKADWSCAIPAGSLDLSVRVAGHVSHFFWSKLAPPGGHLTVGELEFRRGASVIGWVRTAEREAPSKDCRVVLQLSPAVETEAKHSSAGQFASISSTVNARGFFHAANVPAGHYSVTALQPGMLPARTSIVVVEGRETAVTEPLLLAKPATLDVYVDPPQDPSGMSWQVKLLEDLGPGGIDFVVDKPAGADGSWSHTGLALGRSYSLLIKTQDGRGWFDDDKPFTVTLPTTKRFLQLGSERVRGLVTLGRRPLAARVTFGEEREGVSVPFLARKDGSFDGYLPRLGSWRVVVNADSPPVRRIVTLQVGAATSGTQPNAVINLPSASIEGELVTKDGSPVDRAILDIDRTPIEFFQKRVEGGFFRLEGLEKGSYVAHASARGAESDFYPFRVDEEGSDPPTLRIVLKPWKTVTGRVLAANGLGVFGAGTQPVSPPPAASTMGPLRMSDADGRFGVFVPENLSDVCLLVFPPGLATRVVRVPVADEEQIVSVDQVAGELRLHFPAPSASPLGERKPVLFHNGCAFHPGILRRTGDTTREVDGEWSNQKSAHVEPGDYALCALTNQELLSYGGGKPTFPSCVYGSLLAFGRLELKLRN